LFSGISSPRSEAKDGGKLPNPREVSVNVHLDEFRVDSEATLLLRIWAQFVEHDILNTVTGQSGTSQFNKGFFN